MQCTRAQLIGDCLKCEVYVLRHGFSDDEYVRISDSDINHAAKMLLVRDGKYARICPSLRSDGLFAVENLTGRDIWRRIVEAIDESERRSRSDYCAPDV